MVFGTSWPLAGTSDGEKLNTFKSTHTGTYQNIYFTLKNICHWFLAHILVISLLIFKHLQNGNRHCWYIYCTCEKCELINYWSMVLWDSKLISDDTYIVKYGSLVSKVHTCIITCMCGLGKVRNWKYGHESLACPMVQAQKSGCRVFTITSYPFNSILSYFNYG